MDQDMTEQELKDIEDWWMVRSGSDRLQNSDSLRGADNVRKLVAEVRRLKVELEKR